MLSDSCHSGTIGDLKNDLAHYPSGGVTSNNGEGLGVYRENHNDVVSIITCQSYWIYVRARGEVWLTPMDDTLYKSFGERALAIRVNSIPKMLAQNYNNPIKSVTEFKLLASGGYIIDAPEIGIKKLAASCFSPRVKGDGVRGMPKYSYNRDTGTHSHIHGHKKCTFSMRTPSAHGGDLRVISGCEENQTSADTGKNGACTRAFWQTVVSVGGLRSFFIKLFSSHVEDLKVIQDSINYNLSRYGFTQHSIVSWEQAGQRVLHEYNASIGINGCGFTSQDIPQLVNDSRGIITNPTYTHYRI